MKEQIIEKIAEKIGLAVEKVEPFAKEVVSQYQSEQLLYAMAGLITLVLAVGVGVFLYWVATAKNEDGYRRFGLNDDTCIVLGALFGVLPLVLGMIYFFLCLGRYIAPLPNLLGL